MDTRSASIDSILAVYTGSSPGGLSRITDNNNDFGGLRENSFVLRLFQPVPDTLAPRVTSVAPANGATGSVGERQGLLLRSDEVRDHQQPASHDEVQGGGHHGAKDLAGNSLDQRPGVGGNQNKAWFFTTRR